jgi:ribosomal-protein-alanine N-acetyltransferase
MFTRRRKIISRGEAVYLFEPSPAAADDFLAMTTASLAFHQPWVFPATTPRRYRAYLDRLESGGAVGYFIGRLADDALVGAVNVNDIIMGGLRSGSLGYYVGAAFARRGYMREGLALVLDQAFDALELNRLEANVQPDNAASLALIARLGFRKEGFSPKYLQIDGIWRDHERWAILASEWRARRDLQRAAAAPAATAVRRGVLA